MQILPLTVCMVPLTMGTQLGRADMNMMHLQCPSLLTSLNVRHTSIRICVH